MSRIIQPPRQKVVVKVTQRHINEGQRWSPSKDAVARALRAAGLRRWGSGFTSFTVGKYSKRVPMPDSVKEFIRLYDYDRLKCQPFEFEVDLTLVRL
jgi:hypothetical protein